MTAGDIQAAAEMDCVVKLLAICERVTGADGAAAVSVRVHPAMIPRSHPLASVREAFNAVFVEADAAGELMFYGRGAGGDPRHPPCSATSSPWPGTRSPAGAARASRRYADLPGRRHGPVADAVPHQPRRRGPPGRARPGRGGLRRRTTCRSRRCASRCAPGGGERAKLIVVTHRATDAALAATVDALAELDAVDDVASVMRVEGA